MSRNLSNFAFEVVYIIGYFISLKILNPCKLYNFYIKKIRFRIYFFNYAKHGIFCG